MDAAPIVIVAGLSARMMAESAVQAGLRAIALDVFGDADTRHACYHWEPLGCPGEWRIDAERLLAALQRLRDTRGLLGWIAGSGFEDRPELLEAAGEIVPLLGNGAATVRTVKDPSSFFRLLDALGVPHPATRLLAPHSHEGWLVKRIGGTGGWHIRPMAEATGASAGDTSAGQCYYQRHTAGQSMSALFVADGSGARIAGISRQHAAAPQAYGFLFVGASGPAPLAPTLVARLRDMVEVIVRETGLVGLNSIDFLLDGEDLSVLEVNPRPSATMALHAEAFPRGLLHAHLQACQGMLPAPQPRRAGGVRGFRTVFSPRALHVGAALAADLLCAGWCHDIPPPGASVEAGDPLCTVSAQGLTVAAVETALQDRLAQIHHRLEVHHAQHQLAGRATPPQRQYA